MRNCLSQDRFCPSLLAFDDPAGVFTELLPDSYAQFTETVDILSPTVPGTSIAPDTYRVFLGSFRFTAGSSLGATTMRAEDILATNDIITGAGPELDPFIQSAEATVRVSAVTEPSGLVLIGTGAFGLISFARQRRRSAALN